MHKVVHSQQLWHRIHQRTPDQRLDHSSTTARGFDATLLGARLSSSRHSEGQSLETTKARRTCVK